MKNLFYREQWVSDGLIGTYKKVPTILTEVLSSIVFFVVFSLAMWLFIVAFGQ